MLSSLAKKLMKNDETGWVLTPWWLCPHSPGLGMEDPGPAESVNQRMAAASTSSEPPRQVLGETLSRSGPGPSG